MGEVYRAQDTQLDREVAIKVLSESWGDDSDRALRFKREAKTLASLNHPNVAHIYGVDKLDGATFFVLELVEGEDLATRIERGPIPIDETMEICRQIAEGLEAAHEVGVVHRDLKPANVRLTLQGVAKVLDFGLAKPLRSKPGSGETTSPVPGSTLQTEEGLLLGTPTYMSPEQVRAQLVDRRADIWAFGCVLYECLTGTRLFDGASLPDVLAAILEKEPDTSRLPRATPTRVRELITRCLDKNPRTRLQDIGEARIVLGRDHAASLPLSVPVESRRSPIAVLAIAIVSALVAVFATLELTPPAEPINPLVGARLTKLTDFDGTEFDATISRDGKFVAFVSDRDVRLTSWSARSARATTAI